MAWQEDRSTHRTHVICDWYQQNKRNILRTSPDSRERNTAQVAGDTSNAHDTDHTVVDSPVRAPGFFPSSSLEHTPLTHTTDTHLRRQRLRQICHGPATRAASGALSMLILPAEQVHTSAARRLAATSEVTRCWPQKTVARAPVWLRGTPASCLKAVSRSKAA